MLVLKTCKTVEEEQAENYEQPEFVYDPDLGMANFEQPGFIGGTPSYTQKNNCFALDEFSNLVLYV
jgi:hypothetical protein